MQFKKLITFVKSLFSFPSAASQQWYPGIMLSCSGKDYDQGRREKERDKGIRINETFLQTVFSSFKLQVL